MRNHLADVVIPIIHLINTGVGHTEAINTIAKKQKYSNASTCYEACTRRLGFESIYQFLDMINSGKISGYLINRFPNREDLIKKELS